MYVCSSSPWLSSAFVRCPSTFRLFWITFPMLFWVLLRLAWYFLSGPWGFRWFLLDFSKHGCVFCSGFVGVPYVSLDFPWCMFFLDVPSVFRWFLRDFPHDFCVLYYPANGSLSNSSSGDLFCFSISSLPTASWEGSLKQPSRLAPSFRLETPQNPKENLGKPGWETQKSRREA